MFQHQLCLLFVSAIFKVTNGQGTAVSPDTPQRREILPPVPTLTSQQTCPPMQIIGNIDCDTSSTGPVRAGAVRMGCPESSSCMRESTSGQAFCCWESSALVTSPCENPLMRTGGDGQELHSCPCPDATCYSCQSLGSGTGSGICCPTNAAGCQYPGTRATTGRVATGTGVGIPGFSTGGGILLPPGTGVGRFTTAGSGVLPASRVPDGRGGLGLPAAFMSGRSAGLIPAGMQPVGVVPTGSVVPSSGMAPEVVGPAGVVSPGGVVSPTGGVVPTGAGMIPAGATAGGGFVARGAVFSPGFIDPRFRGMMRGPVRGPMMMGAVGGFCPGGVPPAGACLFPYGRCPIPGAACIPVGGGRGICCSVFRGGFGMTRRFFL